MQVLRHIEQSDLGCGGGGGKDNADVFRLAGLTFLTNANAQSTSVGMFINQSQSKHDTTIPENNLYVCLKMNHAQRLCVLNEH